MLLYLRCEHFSTSDADKLWVSMIELVDQISNSPRLRLQWCFFHVDFNVNFVPACGHAMLVADRRHVKRCQPLECPMTA